MKMQSMSSQIKHILSERNMTITDLAKHIGIERSSVSNWIRNNHIPDKHIAKVCHTLNVPTDYFKLTPNLTPIKEIGSNILNQITDKLDSFIKGNQDNLSQFMSQLDSKWECNTINENMRQLSIVQNNRISYLEKSNEVLLQLLNKTIK